MHPPSSSSSLLLLPLVLLLLLESSSPPFSIRIKYPTLLKTPPCVDVCKRVGNRRRKDEGEEGEKGGRMRYIREEGRR
jgi:hypothetical protein